MATASTNFSQIFNEKIMCPATYPEFSPHPGLEDMILLLLSHSLVYNTACFYFADMFGGNRQVRFLIIDHILFLNMF